MSPIRILPDDIANRIAAGEVIERPASVVKELVENSLDAGAQRIAVATAKGGQQLIHVTDNGCGMSRDDALLCIEAHATSKVQHVDDIGRICTLGFRGEALPSIAAVSRFQLQTRLASEMVGIEVLVESGKLCDVRECGCAAGTSIRISHLFADMPGRRKFLKSESTEDAHIQEIILLHALARSDVVFDLTMNGRQVLYAGPAPDPGARLAMLLGRQLYSDMISVDYQEAGIAVTGFVARPGITRGSRREQRLFVNGRPAAADTIFFGIREAYHTLVMKGRYPPVVLYVELAAERVDVNVHPAKREVRFRESHLVGQVVAAAIRRALRDVASDLAPPVPSGPAGFGGVVPHRSVPFEFGRMLDQQNLPLVPFRPPAQALPATGRQDSSGGATVSGTDGIVPVADSGGAGPSASAATAGEIASLEVLGVLDDLYLVATGRSGLVLIDQHAAHERILFEQLISGASDRPAPCQQLLLPVTVELSPGDAALLAEHVEDLSRFGFSVEPFGGHTYIVTAVPARFPQENVSGMLRDICEELRQSGGASPRPEQIRIAQAACKHAVRAADTLSPAEIRRLLADLAKADMPYTCPHGRPVMINISLSELAKRFGRDH